MEELTLDKVLRIERRLVGLDLETTGTNPDKARIVEIGLEIFTPTPDGIQVKEYRTLVNPLMPIPQGAIDAHHITDAMVTGCRVCGEQKDGHNDSLHTFLGWPVFEQLADNLLLGFTDSDVAGFNASRFDVKCLAAEFKRAGKEWDYEVVKLVDGFRLWQVTEPRSLSDACKAENIELLDAHSALADIKASTRFIAARLARFPHLPRTVNELHALCYADRYDADGKFRWRDGELLIAFGQHRDSPVQEIPRSYWSYILRKDFSVKVKDLARNALKGIYPEAPHALPDE